ncbi:MAG: hypothetical protein JO164_13895, partial [Candidatus Eremiobacteraeota bacterium]|nr:hypothetical protein [Candidatus Eremiobacteraeota bacterium]
MLNLDLLRREPDHVKVAVRRRGLGAEFVDRVLNLDVSRRANIVQIDGLRQAKKALSAEVAKAADKKAAAAAVREESAKHDRRIAALEAELDVFQRQIDAELSEVPNLLDGSVP